MSYKSVYKCKKDVQIDEYETLGRASATLLKVIFLQKVTSDTNSRRTRRNNHTLMAPIYNDKIPHRNGADLESIKHNHWGWKKCSMIFREENQVPKFLPTNRNVSSENT